MWYPQQKFPNNHIFIKYLIMWENIPERKSIEIQQLSVYRGQIVVLRRPACVPAKLLQSCPTLCNTMDCSPPGSSVHGILQEKNTGASCHALLQGIFPTQRSNLHLLGLPALAGGFFTTSTIWEALKGS